MIKLYIIYYIKSFSFSFLCSMTIINKYVEIQYHGYIVLILLFFILIIMINL